MQRGVVAHGAGKRMRIQSIAVEGERTEMRAAAKMPTTEVSAAAMAAAEMPATKVSATEMRVAMAAAVTTAVAATVAAATSRDGIAGSGQCSRQNNNGNPYSEF
jgi:hypothetical protein